MTDPAPGPRPRPTPASEPAPPTTDPTAQTPPAQTPPAEVPPPADPFTVEHGNPPDEPPQYSSTIVAPSQIAVSVAVGVILAVIVVGIRTSLWPFAIIVFIVISAVGVYLAGVSVTATRTYLELGQGRREREPRYVSNDEIVSAQAVDLTWPQVFGVGLPSSPTATKSTRLTVRPGPTLVVELRSGEVVRVSTPDPERALAVLGRA